MIMKTTGWERFRQVGLAVAAGLLVCGAGAARAETPAREAARPGGDWTVTVAPYLWATGIEGNVGLLGLPSQPIDLGFGDVLENLEGGFMAVAEARRGRLSFGFDLTYAKLGQSIDTPVGFAATSIEATVKTSMITAVVGYDIVADDALSVDILGGVRRWEVDGTFDFRGGALAGTGLDQSEDWIDPVIGVKFRSPLAPRFELTGWALVGVGSGSDEMWDVMAGSSYRISDRAHLFLGYRAVGVEYRNDGFVYDVIQRGPVFGGVFEF